MPKIKFQISKSQLEELHHERLLTIVEISQTIGCSASLVKHYFRLFKIKKLPKFERLQGFKFERLSVIGFLGIRKDRAAWWLCQCDCGTVVEAKTASLKNGAQKSCGCWNRDRSTSHAMSKTRQYHIWQSMKTRCSNKNNPNFHYYGANGICYDPKWESFDGFWADMQYGYSDNLTIERIDSTGPYSQDNCIWASYETQGNNRSMCVFLEFDGQRKTITEWSKELKVKRAKLYRLKKMGKTDAQIFNEINKDHWK